MSVSLSKGQRVDLTKGRPSLKNILVGLGWDINHYDGEADFDLDASVFMTKENGKVGKDEDFIFYGNLEHSSKSVKHMGDNRTGEGDGDDEVIKIKLDKIPSDYETLVVTVTIYDAESRLQNFGMVGNAYVRVVDEETGEELIRFDLSEDFSTETALVVAEIYKHNGEWKFKAVGSGYNGGLKALCNQYGIDAEYRMTNFMFVIIVAIVLIALILFFTSFGKQLRVKFKGRTDEVMRQDAQTPEGARDYYNAAIRKKEDFYNKASATYAEISGKRDTAEKDLYQANKDIMRVIQQINACLDENKENEAMQYAMKKSTLENKINVLKDKIEEMKEAQAHQKNIRDQAAEELQKLKEEKEQVLFQMETDSQIIELHQSMDSLNTNNESDRMLERVREGARKTRERAEGSRIAYDSSSQANERRLANSERERNARQILDDMKRQRGNK